MAFDTVTEFLQMGGHGTYVWLAYALALAVFLFNVITPGMLSKRFFTDQKRQLRREWNRELEEGSS